MMKLLLTLILLLPCNLFAQEITTEHASEVRLRSTVKYLAETIGERSYRDIEKLNEAARYIEKTFRSYGCAVKKQAFIYKGNTYYNVIAEVQGLNPAKDEILVIGAHYDSAVGTPGADDNASGVAGMLELARLSMQQRPERTIRFVAFSLEEMPAFGTENMGSYVYARSLKNEGAKVYGMIALEMIGYFCDEDGCQNYPPILGWFRPKKGNYIILVGDLSSRGVTKQIGMSFARESDLPMESLNTFSWVTGVDFSDHRNFWHFGYNALMITDTSFYRYGYYHEKEDTPEKLDYKRMAALITGLHKTVKPL